MVPAQPMKVTYNTDGTLSFQDQQTGSPEVKVEVWYPVKPKAAKGGALGRAMARGF